MMPPSLEILNLGDHSFNKNKFTGGIPAEWGSLTNLKELKMTACGLDGEWFVLAQCLHKISRARAQAPYRRRSAT